MKGALFCASALRIATALFCHAQGGLNKGFYLSQHLKSLPSAFICHKGACHVNKYIYLPTNVKKKIPIAKKFFLFHGLGPKMTGIERIIIAKKSHSLSLRGFDFVSSRKGGQFFDKGHKAFSGLLY
jgi:hypothetical protein